MKKTNSYSWYVNDSYTEERWAYADELFSDNECDQIVKITDSDLVTMEFAQIEDGGVQTKTRNSRIAFLPTGDETNWIFERLAGITQRINSQFFNFDLVQIDNLQLTEYTEGYNGFYVKHIDMLYKPFTSRKLSFTVQLSDPNDYEGGDVLLHHGALPDSLRKNKGTISFFPSWTLHEVAPVTKGTRYSLVGWISGPRFK